MVASSLRGLAIARRSSLAAPLHAVPSSCSLRRRRHAKALADASRSAAAAPRRRFSPLGMNRRDRRRAPFARSCRCGRVLSGKDCRHAALRAPLPAAPRAWSLRRCRHAAALTAAPRPAAAGSERSPSHLAWSDAIGGELSLCAAVGAVASSLGGLAIAHLSRRSYLRRLVRGPCAGVVMPLHSRRRDVRPPLLRGRGSNPWLHAARLAARSLCVCRRHSCVVSFGNRRRAALAAPLPSAPRSWSLRRCCHAAALTTA